ncbi:MAG: flagellar basal body P-ring formation chaperone FlgA [Planctomycetota bacterium]
MIPRRLAALLALACITVATQAQTVIELRSSVRLAAGVDATLGAIASIKGDEADRWADVVIADYEQLTNAEGAWREISLHTIREALDAERVNWSRTILRGSAVKVRATPVAKPTPAATPKQAAPQPIKQAVRPSGPTLRDRVAPRLAADLGVYASDLRVSFEPGDRALLATPITGRRVDLTPIGRGDRVPLRATVYEADRIVAEGVVRVAVEIRREVAVLTRHVRRGERISSVDFRRERRWLPAGAAAESPDRVIGAEASGRLREGVVVRAADLVAPAAIERGDRVVVHALSGAFVVRTEARALGDGAEGSVIEFESTTSRGRTFRARVAGPGRAVLLVDRGTPVVAGRN